MFTSHTWVVAITLDSTERAISIIRNILSDSTGLGEKGQTGQLLSKQERGPIWPLQQGWESWVEVGCGVGRQAQVVTTGGAGVEAVWAPGIGSLGILK